MATVGRADRLETLVDAILADPAALELIVVVDGPDHASLRTLGRLAATRPRLRPVQVSHCGQLAALDEGVRRARSDVVVLLDDDVIPDLGTIAGHAAWHRCTPGVVVVGPMPVVAGDTAPGAPTRLYATEYLGHLEAIEKGEVGVLDALWTGQLSLRRDDALRVGLDNPRFAAHYHADRDLGYRMADAGLVGVLDPALTAGHHHHRSADQFLRDAAREGEGRVFLHRLHPQRLGPFQPRTIVRGLPVAVRLLAAVSVATRLARPVSGTLMFAARCWERAMPGVRGAILPVKAARRIMQWHGARTALAAGRSARARAGTAQPF